MQTKFHSDVHTVECHFVNGLDGGIMDHESANSGAYANAAKKIARVTRSRPLTISCIGRWLDWIVQAAREHVRYYPRPKEITPRKRTSCPVVRLTQPRSYLGHRYLYSSKP